MVELLKVDIGLLVHSIRLLGGEKIELELLYLENLTGVDVKLDTIVVQGSHHWLGSGLFNVI